MNRSVSRSLVVAVTLLACAGVGPASAKMYVRNVPIAQWLNAQGVQLVLWQANNGGPLANPPVLGNLGAVDYAGNRAAANGLAFGFSASGSVTVRQQPDGTGLVQLSIDFTNALNFAFDVNFTPIFAYSAVELAGDPTRSPGLCSGSLQAQYTVPDAENPALNLFAVTFQGAGTLQMLKIHTVGTGPLRAAFGVPEGTAGQCVINQTGIFTNGGGATADAFPVEQVSVSAVGSSLQATRSVSALSNSPAAPAVRSSWGQLKALYRDTKGNDQP